MKVRHELDTLACLAVREEDHFDDGWQQLASWSNVHLSGHYDQVMDSPPPPLSGTGQHSYDRQYSAASRALFSSSCIVLGKEMGKL